MGPWCCCSGCPACAPFCVRVSFQVCSACTSACAGFDASARCGPRACCIDRAGVQVQQRRPGCRRRCCRDPAVEDAGELQRKWAEVVERVKARQASYAGLLLNARATADDGSKLTVSFPAGSTFAIKMLGRADTQSVVLPTVCAVFGRRTVDYVLDGVARRLLNMRSILHLHGLRYLRTRNPCPRCPCILERQRDAAKSGAGSGTDPVGA
ncbi:MAG: hypothetical protein ACLRM9_01355 [Collinsella aerofaciens]